MSSPRRIIRIKALEVLYAHEIAKDPIEKVKKDLLSGITDIEKYNFASQLIDSVLKKQQEIDNIIESKIHNWEYDRVSVLDKIIMRIGIAELMNFPEIPPKVTINEAIEIAKEYCSGKSGQFINGILDSYLSELKKGDKLNKEGRGLLDIRKKKDAK
ncbi:MAG: transcription antitermination protein NusB [Bacteroidota bacterium]|nr:transcription antitermination protein NusB [Bacteroidota bacterium]